MGIMEYPCPLCCQSEQVSEQAVEQTIDRLVNLGMPQCQ